MSTKCAPGDLGGDVQGYGHALILENPSLSTLRTEACYQELGGHLEACKKLCENAVSA